MRKKIVPVLAAATMLSSVVLPASSVFAVPPVYLANIKEDIMITKINPKQNYFVIKYDAFLYGGDVPQFVNFQFGGMPDAILHDLYNGEYNQVIYKKNGISVKDGKPLENGDEYKKVVTKRGSNLINNTIGIIDYYVRYADRTVAQRSRADYRRCVNSSVFDLNTMECVMEDLGNGKVQYQPYTVDGERVEIPADEDLMLTQMTENWRAEPGDWGPEWYEEPELEPEVEPELEAEPEPVLEPESEAEPEPEPEPELPVKSLIDDEAEVVAETEAGIESGAEIETETEAGEEVVVASESAISPNPEVMLESASSVAMVDNDNNAEQTYETVTGSNESQQITTIQEGSNAQEDDGIQDREKVGIPDLGKETGSQLNWTAIFAIGVASVVGLVGGIFLFFGKYQSKRRKEKKE